jgi:antirestriction protein ArdC
MPNAAEIRRELTEKIIAALENGVLPWRKSWVSPKNTGRAANVVSRRAYTGINPLLLQIAAMEHGFQSRWWGTYRQWQQLGCQVMARPEGVPPGKWGCQIVFFKPVKKTVVDPISGEEDEEKLCVLRTYSVFNADQVTGPNAHLYQMPESQGEANIHPDFAPADELIANSGADIRYGGDRACYAVPMPKEAWPHHSSGDYIVLPPVSTFLSEGAFYETAFHELAHWSEVRLGWTGSYEMGELVAEMAACFVGAELGIPDGESLENHAAYLQHWVQAMRGNHNYIFKASSQASKVAGYLLAFARKSEEANQPEGELVPV